MGGNVFKDVTSSLTREEAVRFVEDQLPDIMHALDVQFYRPVGSYAQGCAVLHDIDVAAMKPPAHAVGNVSGDEDVYTCAFKNELFEKLQPHGAVKGGSCIHLAWPLSSLMYEGPSDRSVQLDIFPVVDLWSADWLMRGVYRHMLFSLLAKHRSQRLGGNRVTITTPGGVKVVSDSGEVLISRTSHPIVVTNNLGLPPGSWNYVRTFESLADTIMSYAHLSPCLNGFRAYTTHLAGRSDYEQHASYIDSLIATTKADT